MKNHLDALNIRLSNERIHLSSSKTESEKELRKVWISQIEKEIAHEEKFIEECHLSDESLLAELGF